MTWCIDLAVVTIVALAVIRGWRLGASTTAARLVGLLAGLLIGLWLASVLVSDRISPVAHLALGALFCLAGLLAGSWVGRVLARELRRVLAAVRLRKVDQLAGAALRGTLAAALCSIAAAFLAGLAPPAWAQAARSSGVVSALSPARTVVGDVGSRLLEVAPNDLAALVPAAAERPSGTSADQVAARVANSVVEIGASGCANVQGTGFVAASGLVVTNAHVVRGSSHVTVISVDGTTQDATVVAYAPRPDLAVLAVDRTATALTLAGSDASNGTKGVIVGYPEGHRTVTPAAVLLRLPMPDPGFGNGLALHQAYVVHAPVRHGNSGSPLLDLDGRVIGVVNALSSTSSQDGFATTVSELRDVLAHVSATTPVPTGTCAR